jgi:hypothetical protein
MDYTRREKSSDIATERSVVYNAKRAMNNDEKILKALEDLQADITTMKGDVGKIPAIEKQLGQGSIR